MQGIGEMFQQETKYDRRRMPGGYLDWKSKPKIYKIYPQLRQIKLFHENDLGNLSVIDALKQRKSIRDFARGLSVSRQHLSFLLWAAGGIQRKEMGFEFRTVPSAGALYPIETYIVVNNVADLASGVYHYNIRQHSLEELILGDYAGQTARAALDQGICAEAGVVFIWTAVFSRSRWKYKQRAYRYIYLDAGHMAQNLALASTSLGLGCCHIGALFDEEVNRIIGVDGIEESVVYMSVAGHPGIIT